MEEEERSMTWWWVGQAYMVEVCTVRSRADRSRRVPHGQVVRRSLGARRERHRRFLPPLLSACSALVAGEDNLPPFSLALQNASLSRATLPSPTQVLTHSTKSRLCAPVPSLAPGRSR